MPNTLYVQSNFHLPGMLAPSNLAQDMEEILNGIYTSSGILNVSNDNLDKIHEILDSHLKRLPLDLENYLTAISCDMEVAMQEQQLHALANEANIIFQKITTPSPKLCYLDPFDKKSHSPSEHSFKGNIYVINTHGKAGELDGLYEAAIYNNLSIQRIVIDACSSACQGPRKSSSMLERILDDAIKSRKNHALEIVGFNRSYDIDETPMLSCAIFDKKEASEAFSSVISNVTVGERKAFLDEKQNKLRIKKEATANKQPPLRLEDLLLSISTILTRIFFPITFNFPPTVSLQMGSSLNNEQETLLSLGGDIDNILSQINDITKAHHQSSKNFCYKQILNAIKQQKKDRFPVLLPHEQHQIAQNLLEIGSRTPSDRQLADQLVKLKFFQRDLQNHSTGQKTTAKPKLQSPAIGSFPLNELENSPSKPAYASFFQPIEAANEAANGIKHPVINHYEKSLANHPSQKNTMNPFIGV